ncbi:MAG: PQQ-binding-like beta-propeller repeat protein [Planctomycetales bacterium]|nr:PQQ-binding-like beta-propeller repeat protein [Planctomycetales bacterium]
MLRGRLTLTVAAVAALYLSRAGIAAEQDANWPRFGGPLGDFHTSDTALPTEWDAGKIVWRTSLGGFGQSSPVIWNDQIFLTTSEQAADGKVARQVMCVNRKDGKIAWKTEVAVGGGETIHKMNSFATGTCATDGQRVVAYFGPGGLHCLDMQGKIQWSLDLVKPTGPFGFGASPIILGDMVIQNCDAEGPSSLIAVNKNTGETIWRTARKDMPKGGWSTPILIDAGQRKELILNGEFGVHGYNPETGEDLWSCQSFNGRGTPVPAWTHGLLITVNGKPGDLYAVKPGGSGDVTKTHMAWHTARGGARDLPSPVAAGDFCFVVNMAGVGSMYDVASGKELWRERVGGNFSATPLVANGLIYAMDEEGSTLVIRPGAKLDVVAKNRIGDIGDQIFFFLSTPSQGRLLLRSDSTLYCIGSGEAE